MPEVWIVVAKIPRQDGRRRIDRSRPVTYSAARRERNRLERQGVTAWLEETTPALPSPRPAKLVKLER